MFTSCKTLIDKEEIATSYIIKGIVCDFIGVYLMEIVRRRLQSKNNTEVSFLVGVLRLIGLFIFILWKPFEFFYLCGLIHFPILGIFQVIIDQYITKDTKRNSHTPEQQVISNDSSGDAQPQNSLVPSGSSKFSDSKTSAKKSTKKTSASTRKISTKKNSSELSEQNIDTEVTTQNEPSKDEETPQKSKKQTKNNAIEQKKSDLAQLENDLNEKQSQLSSLGSDAMALMQKAKISNEIKNLELQVENMKIEIAKLEKEPLSEER